MEVRSKEGAAKALKRRAHLLALMGMAVANRDQAVLTVQEKHAPLINQLTAEIGAIDLGLESWAGENRQTFGDSQSLEFESGSLIFRVGNRTLDTLAGWTWDKTLKKLKSFGPVSQWAKYIRVKEEVNKQLILADAKENAGPGTPVLPKALLREVGLKIVRTERFEVESKPEMAVEEPPCP